MVLSDSPPPNFRTLAKFQDDKMNIFNLVTCRPKKRALQASEENLIKQENLGDMRKSPRHGNFSRSLFKKTVRHEDLTINKRLEQVSL